MGKMDADGELGELVELRRLIHSRPELAFREVETARLVAERLRAWGWHVVEGVGGTGVVGTLMGSKTGKRAIGLRADMDALAMHEANTFAHRSQLEGKMHACGHDGHVAMLLGAARELAKARSFAGTVHVIFQPAEEGQAGARRMIEDGLFESFPCDAVYAMHNWPGLPIGSFAIRSGAMLAASDRWLVRFCGDGGHGGLPHHGTDPTIPAANFVLALQCLVGRETSASDAAVLSVGHIAAGTLESPNVIPAMATVCGTARTFFAETRDRIERRLGELANNLAAAYGCMAELEYKRGYPPLINHEQQTRVAAAAAIKVSGADCVDEDVTRFTGAEDFAYMLEARPGAYMLLGNGTEGSFVHNNSYDFNDRAIPYGVAYWLAVVQQELGDRS